MRTRPVEFPRDELKHDNVIEWWYFNGVLKDSRGRKYAYMDCFFKADVSKVKIPLLKSLFGKIVYFSHSLVSDIKSKKFYSAVDHVSLVSKDSFTKPLLFVEYATPKDYVEVIEEPKKFDYHLKTENLDLVLSSVKKPLLEEGKGYVHLKSTGSYYYSLTNLETKGVIKIKGKEIKVKGKSWMDHQWANTVFNPKIKWTWFSIQLDNKVEVVCFEFDDGKNKTYLATISYADNKQKSVRDVELIPLKSSWTSPVTKTKYQLGWQIKIPSLKLDVKVEPLLKKQEMIFGKINYWEGGLKVKGTLKGRKVSGQGFLELMGYPKGVSDLKMYKKWFLNRFKK